MAFMLVSDFLPFQQTNLEFTSLYKVACTYV